MSQAYRQARANGVLRLAMSWADIVHEATIAIGSEDAERWLSGMQDILNDPFFVRDPVPVVGTAAIHSTSWALSSKQAMKGRHSTAMMHCAMP